MYCAAPEYFKGETISGNDPLYYASLQLMVTEEDQHQVANFESSHYNVAVEVVNLHMEGGNIMRHTNHEAVNLFVKDNECNELAKVSLV